MSDKEKTLVEQLKELPADIQDKFLLMAQGAAVAVDCAKAREEKDEEDIRAIEEYAKQQLERRREWEAGLEREQERFRAAQAAKTPEELEAEEKLWRERFRAPGSDQTSSC